MNERGVRGERCGRGEMDGRCSLLNTKMNGNARRIELKKLVISVLCKRGGKNVNARGYQERGMEKEG